MNGSRHAHLQEIALSIHRICQQYGIQLVAEWVPREENELADYYSKIVDADDWSVNPVVFEWLDEEWGPHTLDCFASVSTRKADRYCSRWWNPGCVAVDAFTFPWEGENVWLTPPLYLIGKVIKMVEFYECHATLIVPKWVSAAWWPLLFRGTSWCSFVKECIDIPLRDDTFLQGTCPWNLFGKGTPKCKVLAIHLCTVARCKC